MSIPEVPQTPELPEDAHDAFEVLWAHYEVYRMFPLTVNSAFEAAMQAAWNAKHEKKKRKPEFTLNKACKAFPDLNDEWRSWSEGLEDSWYEEKKALEAKLVELAGQATPVASDEWTMAYTVDNGAYRSVDMGSGTYAHNEAKNQVLHYQHQGLEAELRIERRERPSSLASQRGKPFKWTDYEVWVKANPIDIKIADRRPGMSMVEWVASCWKSGVNPRVYQPFLPHGFEEAHGIGWNGQITPPSES